MNNHLDDEVPLYEKTILCLANSRKYGGRCVAGKEAISGGFGAWVCPVSGDDHQAISWDDRHFEDGSDPQVLDIIKIPMIEAKPETYQS